MERLIRYFSEGAGNYSTAETVGIEVETQFIEGEDVLTPITLETSQKMLRDMADNEGWRVSARKGDLITELQRGDDKVLYELSRANIELSQGPLGAKEVVKAARRNLETMYASALRSGARPYPFPILQKCGVARPACLLPAPESLLVIPDERDRTWLELDGEEALSLLTLCSAVQFTVDVPLDSAIPMLNSLGGSIAEFLSDYPQDELWRRYIRESKAGYSETRYGGPLQFNDLRDYCRELSGHQVVNGTSLLPFPEIQHLNVELFLRSVWWYFRLRRYGPKLCVEVRPLPRSSDELLESQLEFVLDVISSS